MKAGQLHIHRPPLIELRSRPLHETRPGHRLVTPVPGVHQAIPLLTLGGSDELEQIRCVHTGNTVEVGRSGRGGTNLHLAIATVINEPRDYVSLEGRLVCRCHAFVPVTIKTRIRYVEPA